jgi:hypothetical protein
VQNHISTAARAVVDLSKRNGYTGHSLICFVLMLVLALLAVCAGQGTAAAGDAEVKVSLDRTKILVGEPVVLGIELRWREPVQVPTVAVPQPLGALQVLKTDSSEDAKGPDGTWKRVVTVRLTSFEIGAHELPAIDIPYLDGAAKSKSVSTPAMKIEVSSYLSQLPTKEKTALRPVKPPLRMPVDWRSLLIASLIGLVVAMALFGTLWRVWKARRNRQTEEFVAPPLPADEEALRALADVEVSGMVDQELAKVYYLRLSEILRRYLGRRYTFDALEMTSSELLERAERLGLRDGVYQDLADDSAESDSVKFARYAPSRPKRLAALERVRRIVVATRPAPLEPIAGAESGNGSREEEAV